MYCHFILKNLGRNSTTLKQLSWENLECLWVTVVYLYVFVLFSQSRLNYVMLNDLDMKFSATQI